MNPVDDLAPIEELDQNILTLCSRINAATYELLVLIREFDERAGWLVKTRCWRSRCAQRRPMSPSDAVNCVAAASSPIAMLRARIPTGLCEFVVTTTRAR